MLAISASPAIQRQAAEIYARDKTPAPSTSPVFRRPKRDRIRIGYFSADYYKHVTSYLIAELFERHDRSRFEILGFAFGPDIVDEMTQRISTAMDSFIDVRSMRDPEVAELSRKLEVDIAVDVNGFTTNSRPGIFAQRAAPIQVNYLAYPGTMGAQYMDYLIADHTLIPQAAQCHYSEKIVYMPDSYQVNDSRRAISPIPCARFQEGLPETAFVFCCFNNIYKISPDSFDSWMRILGRVLGSVLWLLEDNPSAVENLRKRAALRGIDPQRLVFAKRMPVDQHLTRQGLADLVLDTLPYNAHTTASDALWVGLPVLTRIGDSLRRTGRGQPAARRRSARTHHIQRVRVRRTRRRAGAQSPTPTRPPPALATTPPHRSSLRLPNLYPPPGVRLHRHLRPLPHRPPPRPHLHPPLNTALRCPFMPRSMRHG